MQNTSMHFLHTELWKKVSKNFFWKLFSKKGYVQDTTKVQTTYILPKSKFI